MRDQPPEKLTREQLSQLLREILSGVGKTYEVLSRDFAKVKYKSVTKSGHKKLRAACHKSAQNSW